MWITGIQFLWQFCSNINNQNIITKFPTKDQWNRPVLWTLFWIFRAFCFLATNAKSNHGSFFVRRFSFWWCFLQWMADGNASGSALPPIVTLSDSSSDGENSGKRGLKRKAAVLDDEQSLRISLGRRCSCKQGCMDKFAAKGTYQQLLAMRKNWRQLHKLDQDQVVAGLIFIVWSVFPPKIVCKRDGQVFWCFLPLDELSFAELWLVVIRSSSWFVFLSFD